MCHGYFCLFNTVTAATDLCKVITKYAKLITLCYIRLYMYKIYIGAYGCPPHAAQKFLALASVGVNKLKMYYINNFTVVFFMP